MNRIYKSSGFAGNYRFLLVVVFIGFVFFSCGCVDTGNRTDENPNDVLIRPTLSDDAIFITIDPITAHKAGDSFNISGTTTIGSDNKIRIEIAEDPHRAERTRKNDGRFYGVAGNATIIKSSNGINRWEFNVNTSGWLSQEYYVNVFSPSDDGDYTRVFSLLNLTS